MGLLRRKVDVRRCGGGNEYPIPKWTWKEKKSVLDSGLGVADWYSIIALVAARKTLLIRPLLRLDLLDPWVFDVSALGSKSFKTSRVQRSSIFKGKCNPG